MARAVRWRAALTAVTVARAERATERARYSGNIGIVATPVIDAVTHTMYVVTRTVEGGTTLPRLHAVDIVTGLDLPSSPVLLQAQLHPRQMLRFGS